MMRRACNVCSSPHAPLDVRGLCSQCRAAYALGREEALAEALACALRVRGEPRTEREMQESQDEHEDGVQAAGGAIVTFVRKLVRRRYPPRART